MKNEVLCHLKNPRVLIAYWIVGLLFILLLPSAAFPGDVYNIKLKNGRVITTTRYYEEGDKVFAYKFGGYISFSKNEVAEINSEDGPMETASPAPSSAPSGSAADSKDKMTRGREAKQKPIKHEMTEKEKLDKEIESRKETLESNRRSLKNYCGSDDDAPAQKPTRVYGSQDFEEIKKNIQQTTASYQANSTCNYYKNKVPELERQLDELILKRNRLP
jgi:hypothetical protein